MPTEQPPEVKEKRQKICTIQKKIVSLHAKRTSILMEQSKNSGFNSKLGVILAAAGSAIGLGNIWKFPYEAGQNGGGAFLLVYLLCVILFGMPLLMTEILIGRKAGQST